MNRCSINYPPRQISMAQVQCGYGYDRPYDDFCYEQNTGRLGYRSSEYNEPYYRLGPRDGGYSEMPSLMDNPRIRNSPFTGPHSFNSKMPSRMNGPPIRNFPYNRGPSFNSKVSLKPKQPVQQRRMRKTKNMKSGEKFKDPDFFKKKMEFELNKPWIVSESMKALIREKYKLFEKLQETQNQEDYKAYRFVVEHMKEKLLLSKLEYLGTNLKEDIAKTVGGHPFEYIVQVAAKHLVARKANLEKSGLVINGLQDQAECSAILPHVQAGTSGFGTEEQAEISIYMDAQDQ